MTPNAASKDVGFKALEPLQPAEDKHFELAGEPEPPGQTALRTQRQPDGRALKTWAHICAEWFLRTNTRTADGLGLVFALRFPPI